MQIANNSELVVRRWWRYSDYICLFIKHFNGLFHDDNRVLGGEGHPAHETAAQIRSCQAHTRQLDASLQARRTSARL